MKNNNEKLRFVILSLRNNHGGPIVLKTLCKNLTLHGYEASIYIANGICIEKRPFRRIKSLVQKKVAPVVDYYRERNIKKRGKESYKAKKSYRDYVETDYSDVKITRYFRDNRNTIVVYPDLVYGNPLNASKVVRYFLSYNRYKDDENAYDSKDLFICYRKTFNDWNLNPNGFELFIQNVDLDLYKRTNYGRREGKCYIVRKGCSRPDIPPKIEGIVIDDLEETMKVKVFNECEYCISYDTQTAYSSIAAICGCISIVVPETGKSRYDYRSKEEVATNHGIAFGFSEEEIKYAINTMNLVKDDFNSINEQSNKKTEEFIDMCIKHFY